jgi:hypothetical protein
MAGFVTEMGKIKGRADTKLTRKSQRRLGQAIRRAKMMGLTPMLSRTLPGSLVSDTTLLACSGTNVRSEGKQQ